MAVKMNKTEVKKDKPVYLGLSMLDISRIAMYNIVMII